MAAKYIRLANILRDMISKSDHPGSLKLPTELELCRKYNVSRQTVRRALLELEQENLIIRRQGSGSFATGLLADMEQNRVAVMLPTDSEYIYPSLITDLKNAFEKQGYVLTIYVTNNNVVTERALLKDILAEKYRGVLVEGVCTALPNPNLDLYDLLQSRGVSLLFLHGYYPDYDAPYVMDDNVNGGYMLGKHLRDRKHEKISGIFARDDLQGLRRYLGLQMAMRDTGSLIPEHAIAWFGTDVIHALRYRKDTRFLTSFIRKQGKDASAIVCYNDEIAYWLMKELKIAGRNIPDDITIVSFDNSYLSTFAPVSITSLTHNAHEVGKTAAENLIRSMHGLPIASKKIPWHLTTKGISSR